MNHYRRLEPLRDPRRRPPGCAVPPALNPPPAAGAAPKANGAEDAADAGAPNGADGEAPTAPKPDAGADAAAPNENPLDPAGALAGAPKGLGVAPAAPPNTGAELTAELAAPKVNPPEAGAAVPLLAAAGADAAAPNEIPLDPAGALVVAETAVPPPAGGTADAVDAAPAAVPVAAAGAGNESLGCGCTGATPIVTDPLCNVPVSATEGSLVVAAAGAIEALAEDVGAGRLTRHHAQGKTL